MTYNDSQTIIYVIMSAGGVQLFFLYFYWNKVMSQELAGNPNLQYFLKSIAVQMAEA